MRIGLNNRLHALWLAGLLACAGFSAAAAEWGSLRGNNHAAAREPQRSAPIPVAPQPRVNERERVAPQVREHLPPVGREEHRELEAHRRAEIERETHERRRWDIDADRRHSYFWFGYHPGMVVNVLPPDYSQIYVSGNPYYYDQGVYYETGPAGYMVVAPPLGAVVPNLPPGAEPVVAGPTVYYYAGGAFYLPQPQGFVVVAPPMGVTISTLPPGATPIILNGVQYYQANGVYFMPVIQNGVVVYMTAQP